MKLLLASNSPRRKELLRDLGYTYETVSISCEETFPEELAAAEVAGYLADLKSLAYHNLQTNEILLTADTVVVFENKLLGKPKNEYEAREMLRLLSGNVHHVYTGITLRSLNKKKSATECAAVYFEPISENEIDRYLTEFQPFDKAGSYGIQEWLGMAKISKIEGSFYTVMGLPTHLVYRLLNSF